MTKLTTIKPPISRMGGKSRLKNEIIKRMPIHRAYVELFFGAGWVYFSKEPSKLEIINDIDGNLINLFRVIKKHPQEFERLLELEPIANRDRFNEALKGLAEIPDSTDIERAIDYIYSIKYSFGAKGEHFGYSRKSPPRGIKAEISTISNRLKNTYIENLDYEKIIDKYDSEESFFFVDPPYIETAGYQYPFDIKAHENLSKKLTKLKGNFLLTLNDCSEARELYKNLKIEEAEVMYSVSKKNKIAKELLIMNY